MKKKLKGKNRKILAFLITILILVMGITIFIIVRRNRNEEYVLPISFQELNINSMNDQIVKCENKKDGIEIGKVEFSRSDKEYYITLEISNITEEDRFNVPFTIQFINMDGDSIFTTGYVQDVLFKNMVVDINAKITPQIAKMINMKQIDRIIISD